MDNRDFLKNILRELHKEEAIDSNQYQGKDFDKLYEKGLNSERLEKCEWCEAEKKPWAYLQFVTENGCKDYFCCSRCLEKYIESNRETFEK